MRSVQDSANIWSGSMGLLKRSTLQECVNHVLEVTQASEYRVDEWKQFKQAYGSGASEKCYITNNGTTIEARDTFDGNPLEIWRFESPSSDVLLEMAIVKYSFDVNRDFTKLQTHFPMAIVWSSSKFLGIAYAKEGQFEVYMYDGGYNKIFEFPDFETEGRPEIEWTMNGTEFNLKCGTVDFTYDTGTNAPFFIGVIMRKQEVANEEIIKDFRISDYRIAD